MKILTGLLFLLLLGGYVTIVLATTAMRAAKRDEGMDDPTGENLW